MKFNRDVIGQKVSLENTFFGTIIGLEPNCFVVFNDKEKIIQGWRIDRTQFVDKKVDANFFLKKTQTKETLEDLHNTIKENIAKYMKLKKEEEENQANKKKADEVLENMGVKNEV